MKKFLNTRCIDMTIGGSIKFTVIITAVMYAVTYLIFNIEKVISVLGEIKDLIIDRFTKVKNYIGDDYKKEEP